MALETAPDKLGMPAAVPLRGIITDPSLAHDIPTTAGTFFARD
jgi:hypothetical protein